MKTLANLRPAKGSNKDKKRLGRGMGSGLGKTAGKGHKGQHARSGGKVRPGFEGGQTPLYRRLPKRGFKNLSRVCYQPVNIEVLNRFEDDSNITRNILHKAGIINSANTPVKLLGRGVLEKKLRISLDKVSSSAKEAVLKLGGSIEES